MGVWKKTVLFSVGGSGYVGLELLWRGRSHGSMFLAGGGCFLLLGSLNRAGKPLPLPVRAVAGAGVITGVELIIGLLANRDYQVWDYRDLPLNYQGQICLPYSLLWIPVSMGAMLLHSGMERFFRRS